MAATASPRFTPEDQRAVRSVATQFFVNGAIFASFIPRLPEIQDRLGVSIDVLGALMTAALAIGLAGSALSAPLIGRVGTRTTLIVGASLLIAALPIMGLATTPVVFVIGLGVMASLDVIVDVSMNLQGSWLNARRHAPIMNRLHGLWSLGTVVGGLTSAQLATLGVSLQAHLLAVTVILFVALRYVGQGLLRTDEHVEESADDGTGTANRWPLVALALAGAFAIIVELVSSDFAAFRLRDDFDTSEGFAGLGYVAYTAGMTAGRFGGDYLTQRWGADRLAQVAIAASFVGLVGATLAPDRFVVLISYIVAGVGISTFFPRLYDEAAQLPGRRGAGLAALTGGSRIAGLLAPLAVGALAATSLSVGSATAILVLPSCIAFGLLTLGPTRTR